MKAKKYQYIVLMTQGRRSGDRPAARRSRDDLPPHRKALYGTHSYRWEGIAPGRYFFTCAEASLLATRNAQDVAAGITLKVFRVERVL